MKAKPFQINALIPHIQKNYQGALIYGPEQSIVQEVSEKISNIILSNIHDDFCSVKISLSKIKEIPSILLDEGNVSTLMGGRKLIWVKESDGTIFSSVETYFNQIKTDSFLLISAGNLNKNSDLRIFCENHPNILAVACYKETQQNIIDFIQGVLAEYRIRINQSLMPVLIERLGDNRLIIKQEIKKLSVYMEHNKDISELDICQLITDSTDSSMEQFCIDVAGGQLKKVSREYKILLENGENPVSIVRSLHAYFNRLLDVVFLSERMDAETAVSKVLKASQFRLKDCLINQIRYWQKDTLLKVIDKLVETERQLKTTGMPADLILERLVLTITQSIKRKM